MEITDPNVIQKFLDAGIDPTGKSIQDLEDEITTKIATETSRVIFDPTDPLDYLSAGLTLTGVGTAAGLGLKSLRAGRKGIKAKQNVSKLKQLGELLNPLKKKPPVGTQRIVQPGMVGPGQVTTIPAPGLPFTLKPVQSLIYGGEGVQALDVGLAEADRATLQADIDALKIKEKKEIIETKDPVIESDPEVPETTDDSPKIGDEKIIEGNTYVFTKDGFVLKKEERKPKVSDLFGSPNFDRFLRNVGASLVETGQIGAGLAQGAAKAAEEKAAEELALELAQVEASKKERPTANYIEDRKVGYQTTTKDYQRGQNTISLLSNVLQIAAQDNITGALAFAEEIAYKGFAAFNPNAMPDPKTFAANILKEIASSQPGELLGQTQGRLSDRDIQLARDLLADIELSKGIFKSTKEIQDILSRRLTTLNIEQNSRLTQIYNDLEFFKQYGVAPPVIVDDALLSGKSKKTQEKTRLTLEPSEEEKVNTRRKNRQN